MRETPEIAFFEVEPWEREWLSHEPAEGRLAFFPERLSLDTVEQVAGVPVISTFINTTLPRRLLERLPSLRLIATRSTGYDHINLEACRELGIAVANVPRYGENTVAEHTFGLILSLSRKIHHAYVRTSRGDFSLEGLRGFDLNGKTLGVIGAGSIGLHVIRIAKGFGMEVLAFDVRHDALIAEVLGFTYVSLEELLKRSDIVTLHAPYVPATHHIIDRERLSLMKRGALLINTARGGLVDTEALIWALDEGILGGVGLDVLEGEELIKEERQLLALPAAEQKLKAVIRGHILLRRENVVITPHIAFNSQEALLRILETTAENIRGFLAGKPQNLVVPPGRGNPIQRRAAS